MTFASWVGAQTGKVASPPDPMIGDTLLYRITDLWSGISNNRDSLQPYREAHGSLCLSTDRAVESGRVGDAFFSRRLGACIGATTCVDVYNFRKAVGGRQSIDGYAALRVSRIWLASRRPRFLSATIACRCWERGRALPSSQL